MKKKYSIIINLLSGLIRSVYSSSQYCIKKGYKHRTSYRYYDNTPCSDEWQNEIYIEACRFAKENNLNKVIDIGCGSAFKLLKHFSDFETIGVDVPETYNFLQKKYPQEKWLSTADIEASELTGDLIICSDVIEHVEDPNKIIEQIKQIKNIKFIFISTPERNILNGCYHYGPPRNPHHLREWSGWEFRNFISQHFNILSHTITNYNQGTQLIVCN
ncbi:MAG: methyltransferase domain-containing protein [Marinilabiliaceae bacterium]|nr:methyltransferase domain-containing protein [Marinilabiliaceae bacterium]